LDFEGIYGNTVLGNDETEEVPSGDVEHTLERIQADVVLTTPLEDGSQIIEVLGTLFGASSEVVQVG
jgi:hypothetical protein